MKIEMVVELIYDNFVNINKQSLRNIGQIKKRLEQGV
jgi:hypothetical protein